VTSGVIVALILAGTVVVLVVLGCVTYLTARGYDPQPVVQLTGTLIAAAGATGSFIQGLVYKRVTAKVERNTGMLTNAMYEVADALPRPVPRHAYDDTAQVDMRAAPAPRGS